MCWATSICRQDRSGHSLHLPDDACHRLAVVARQQRPCQLPALVSQGRLQQLAGERRVSHAPHAVRAADTVWAPQGACGSNQGCGKCRGGGAQGSAGHMQGRWPPCRRGSQAAMLPWSPGCKQHLARPPAGCRATLAAPPTLSLPSPANAHPPARLLNRQDHRQAAGPERSRLQPGRQAAQGHHSISHFLQGQGPASRKSATSSCTTKGMLWQGRGACDPPEQGAQPVPAQLHSRRRGSSRHAAPGSPDLSAQTHLRSPYGPASNTAHGIPYPTSSIPNSSQSSASPSPCTETPSRQAAPVPPPPHHRPRWRRLLLPRPPPGPLAHACGLPAAAACGTPSGGQHRRKVSSSDSREGSASVAPSAT